MNGLGALTHLWWYECRRNLRPLRLLMTLGPLAVLAFISLWERLNPNDRFLGSLTMVASSYLPEGILLVTGIAAGTLAEDRRRGVTLTVLARGLSRGQYLLAKSLAAAVSSGLIVLAGIGVFYLFAWVMLPAGPTTRAVVSYFPGPVPALFYESPLGNDLLSIAMYLAAAAALSQVGLLAGTVVANEYVVMVTPALVVLLGVIVASDSTVLFSPFTYLNLQGSYAPHIPDDLRPYAAFGYWLAFGTCTGALTRLNFAWKELA